MSEALSGAIERVTFHNPENGFVVLRVQAKGRRGLVTVVGQTPRAVAGEYVEATGSWKQDVEHGEQFHAETLRTMPPSSLEGIEKYLGSGLIKGIGAHYAKKIVSVFGLRTLQVIDESPTFLKEVKGIGSRRIQQIRESWRQQKAVRDIMVFLSSHGVGVARAVRIWKTYGDKALDLVKANPYRLADDIWGIGFQTADALAQRIGIDAQSPQRAQAALRHVLNELSREGHCGYPEDEVLRRTQALTGIDEAILVAAVATLVRERAIERESVHGMWLFLKRLHTAEVEVALGLHTLRHGRHPLPAVKIDVALDWVQQRIGLTLAASQAEAIRQAAAQKTLVITGGPGVGKTTLVRGILEIFLAKKLRVLLAAPTGRAAKRLTESTGQEAKTIHRLLEFDRGGPKRDRDRSLDVDLLIIDETSMVDITLMHHLVNAIPPHACLILVGDVDQLPSVGPGTVLADIIASKAIPVVRLTEIFRQAQQSAIVRAAHQIHEGQLPESSPPSRGISAASPAGPLVGDFYFIEVNDPPVILDRILQLLRERIPARFHLDPLRDVQVLTPMNRSDLGVRNLNQRLQADLNPAQGDGAEVARFGWTFRVGDKVLQTVNNYDKEVFNGDIGRITKIDEESQELTVDFEGAAVVYEFEELDELALAYALTIHKSQGSEYPAVVIPLHTQHYLLLQRNLLYTGVTRGKQLVVLVGSKQALSLAVQRQDTARRCTALAARLSSCER